MKKTKRVLSLMFSILLIVAMTLTGVSFLKADTDTQTTTSWNFEDSNFKDLGTLSDTRTVDSLTLVATDSLPMQVKVKNVTLGDKSFTYALALNGKGDQNGRAVKVPVAANDVVKVTLQSSSSTEARTLILADSAGNQLSTMTADVTANTQSYTYTGSEDAIWLYSQNSGIDLFEIEVESTETSTGNIATPDSSANETVTIDTNDLSDNQLSSDQLAESKIASNAAQNYLADGWYYLKNINSQKYLDVSGKRDADGSNVIQYSGNGGDNQKWYVTNLGNNYITLRSGLAGGRMLDVANGGRTDGTNIQIYSANGADAQIFQVVPTKTANTYCLLTKCSGGTQAVDVNGWSKEDNGDIKTWTYNGYECQQFKFESTTANSGNSSSSGSTNTSDGTVVTNYKDLLSAVSKAEKAGGGKVYVKGTSITCSGQIALSKTNANVQIIGVKNSDGTYPRLDFSTFMNQYIGKASSDSAVGVRITGSKYTLQNLIVEHAPDNGIQIKGSNAGNNKVSNCITRYNNDAGLQVTLGAYKNTIEYVCSYRNCDVYTRGGNADGFAPKLGAGSGNTFSYCYAWDNSDDGWDSFDKAGDVTPDISYTYCAVWNNGNPNVFTGKYDFDNGKALDENLLLVQLIKAKDSSFVSKYTKRQFSLPTGNFIKTDAGTISLSAWTGSSFDGNPNGFKLGSANSKSNVTRTLSYCLAFDESKKGFDNNNSSVTGYFNHCIAFDNGYNYYIQPLTIKGWGSVQGFSGKSGDKLPSGFSVNTPSSSSQSSIRKSVESTKNSIIASCQANKIPGKVTFNIFN
ncbi:RICIN domain-containing protein [Streptococcus gallolyticus]|uniref:RICIN domain-containing protein n=1 Tax=Streptococcus gallolyticus TaxID=315405 RepID=UPI0034A2E44A